jgi:OFA family oxalate/formate antiporter-like MFS transporter
MCTFCLGGLRAGLLSKVITTRWIIIMCAVFVSAGFGIASRIDNLAGFYICYGGCVGLGIGFAYNAVISSVTRWFPEKTGFVSGVLLMGFGLGGMALGTSSTILIGLFGWRVVFLGIAAVYFALVFFCSFIIYPPPANFVSSGSADRRNSNKQEDAYSFTTREMLGDFCFWLIFIWAVCLSAGGLALIGHASPFAIDMGAGVSAAAFYAGLISIFNGTGRVVFGLLFDKIGRRPAMSVVSCGFILSAVILVGALSLQSIPLLLAGYICIGLSYGGIMPCNSTIINKLYGQKHYPVNFSMITMNILIASPLGPFMAGVLQQASGSYFTTLYIIGLFGITAFILSLIIRPGKQLKENLT